MMKAVVAGLLAMTALVPPALAQEPTMDRGDFRRERAERPPMPPRAEGARPDGARFQAARPDEPRPEPRIRPDMPRDDGGRPAPERGWQRAGGPDRVAPHDVAPEPNARRWEGDPLRGDRGPRVDRVDRGPDGRGPGVGGPEGRDWQSRRDDRWDRAQPVPPTETWRSGRNDTYRRWGNGRRDNWRPEPSPAPLPELWRSQRGPGWDRDWRRDPRYDWGRYREQRSSVFRLPRYYAPYGWDGGYRRFGIGMPLAPMLFTPRYWIYDPYAYRLPPAEEPYRWVRYYGDALLVDIEDGTVVDVIHGIFE